MRRAFTLQLYAGWDTTLIRNTKCVECGFVAATDKAAMKWRDNGFRYLMGPLCASCNFRPSLHAALKTPDESSPF